MFEWEFLTFWRNSVYQTLQIIWGLLILDILSCPVAGNLKFNFWAEIMDSPAKKVLKVGPFVSMTGVKTYAWIGQYLAQTPLRWKKRVASVHFSWVLEVTLVKQFFE